MRILLVNGNTTQEITDRAVAAARRAAPKGTEVVGISAPFGANVVTTSPENLIAGHAILDALARHHQGFDAVILAISFDTALAEARELLRIPIYGITESALLEAVKKSDKIGVIIFGAASLPLYRSVFDRYPSSRAIAEVAMIDVASTKAYVTAGGLDVAILTEVNRMVRAHGIGATVICGAALAGIAERLQPQCDCLLVDGVPAAIRAALASQGAPGSGQEIAQSTLARSVRLSGVSTELALLFEDRR